ncbi:MAG: PQQ-binding-like beta-propeller repeat protein [Candidatus Acetothermia bacterium]|jgi:subtilase family serine protease|nr:PQQ-binding-like beta-propeller repeat protein [Candidatus Acetothermia bacterium]MDH7505942.1 CARDB domain-containing protein [Candidatus Acetothermia bacterium]
MARGLKVLGILSVILSSALAVSTLSQAQFLPDLVVQELTLSPPSPVAQGVIVRVALKVSNIGEGPAGPFSVELCWRRVDRAECCGFSSQEFTGLQAGGETSFEAQIKTANLTPGSYEVTVRVDPDNRVSEGDETNNRATIPLEVLPPKPELHPISLSFNPPSPVKRGQTVRVSTEIENTGESTAGGFHVEFLYSLNGRSWTSFGAVLVAGLDRNGRVILEQSLDTSALELDPPTEPTTLSIRVVVDPPTATRPHGQVEEQDESNNEMLAWLGVAPSKLDLPELHPVSITFNRDLPLEWGRDITATALIMNTGGQRADNILVEFSYRRLGAGDWQRFASATIDTLGIEEKNNSDTVTGRLDVPGLGLEPGSYQLRVVVDPENTINEQNEANNELVVSFFVQGSELLAQGLEVETAPVHQGDTITVFCQVKNTGKKPAQSFTVGFFIDNLRFDTFYYTDVEGLRQGETVKVQGKLDTTDLPPGEYTLRVFVDPDNQIPELDEVNNMISTALTILAPRPRLAELHPTSLLLDPPSPVRQGQVVRVLATVWNTGNIDAGRFQVELAYSVDGQSWIPFAIRDVPGLGRGAKEIIEGRLPTTELSLGVSYKLRVLVDLRNEVPESDETNNTLITGLSLITPVTPPEKAPNLTLRDLTFAPPSPVSQGTQVQVCAEIANTGEGAAGDFQVEFLYRQDQVGTFIPFASKSVPRLEVGRSMTVCEVFNTAGLGMGSYELKVIADPGNWVLEQNEGDNELVRTLIISAPVSRPDLYPAGLTFDPPSAVQGDLVRVCVRIANIGTASAGPFTVSYSYLVDAYVQFATAAVSGLAAGSQTELCRVLATSGLGQGTYEIKIKIDPDNRVAEQNEVNNELAAYLTIGPPTPPKAELALQTGGPVRILRLDEGTGVVYIASEDGNLYALERGMVTKAGFPFPAGSAIRALVIDTGAARAAYLGTVEGKLYVVRLDSGREICRASLEGEIRALGLDRLGNIYAGAGAHLVSLTSACQTRWEFATAGTVRALAVNDARGAIYVATSDGWLYALDRDGARKWELDLRSPLTALALGEAIYVGTEDGKVQTVSFGGSTGWSFTAGGAITSIVVDAERHDPIYATSVDEKLYSLDLSGGLRWAFLTGGPIYATPAIDGRSGALFFGSDDRKLYGLTGDRQQIFAVEVGSAIRSNAVIDVVVERVGTGVKLVRTVYFGAENQNAYLLRAELP